MLLCQIFINKISSFYESKFALQIWHICIWLVPITWAFITFLSCEVGNFVHTSSKTSIIYINIL